MKTTLLLCAALVCARAQEPARTALVGHVLDPSGAVIPGASVRAGAGPNETTVTDRRGDYVLNLAPGAYRITAEAPGFDRFTRDNLLLQEGKTVRLDVDLVIATVTQQVTVKAPALEASPETRTGNLGEVLEIREVRESSAKDVGEALARLEGLWKIRKGGIASDVVLRGFQQGNINLLVDGERIFGACPNHMDPPGFHVDFSEIKQVEVTKGAFDVRDQGSLGGVVNIVSKEPSAGLRFTPNVSMGSFGYYNPSLTASFSTEKLYGLAGYSYRRSDPYVDGAGRLFTAYANYKPGSATRAFDAGTGWFRLGGVPARNHHVDFAYTAQRTGATLYPYLMMDSQYDNADRASASYQIDDLSGGLKQLRFQTYFTRVRHYMTDDQRISSNGAPRPYSMATLAATKSLGARVEAEFTNFSAGFEGYRRNWNGVNTMRMMGSYMDQTAVPDVNMSVAGLYAEYHRTFFDRLRLTTGARFDAANSAARGASANTDMFWAYKGTRSTSKNDAEPSATLWLAYTLPKGLEIFGGLGHTARLPDPEERYFALRRSGSDWVGNPNLLPTRNTETDIGIAYRGRRFSLKPTLFYSSLEDYITVQNQARINPLPAIMGMMTNSAARSYENVQAAIYGGELTYSVGISRALLLSGGLSVTHGIKRTNSALRILNGNIAEMPPLKSHTALRYGTRRFFAEFETLAVNAQRRVDSDLNEQSTPGYAILNLKVGLHTSRLNIAAGFDNLANRFYYESLSFQRDPFRTGVRVPEPGRSLYLTTSYAF